MAGSDITLYTTPAPPTLAVIPQHYAHPGLSLQQLLSILRAHLRLTLLVALCMIALSLAVSRLIPRTYESTATLMIDYEVNDPLAGKEFPISLLGSYISTQMELMQSPEMLRQVVDRLDLGSVRRYTAGYHGNPSGLKDWATRLLAKNLHIEQGRYGSHLIYVTYAAPDPNEASSVANTLADVYTEQQYQRQNGPATERARRYAAQLDELKNKVSRAQEQVTEFRQRTGLLDTDAHIDIEMERLSTLQQRLLEAQTARQAAEARSTMRAGTESEALSSSLLQSLKTQLAAQQAQMADLRATLGPRHPQVEALQQQIDSTRRSLAGEMQNYSSGSLSQAASARQLERALQQSVEEQRAKVLQARSLQDQLSKYTVELDSAQSVYKRALDGYDQIMFASSDRYSNVSFVSRASPPLKASKPDTPKLLLLGVVGGVILGFGAPLLYELLLSRRIRCRDDLERDYGIPMLAELCANAAEESRA